MSDGPESVENQLTILTGLNLDNDRAKHIYRSTVTVM